VPAEHLFDAPNAHDQETTRHALATFDPLATRAAFRARLGARERVALVAGRLVPAKGIEELLEAWAGVPASTRENWTLVFVGDGPLAFRVSEAATRRRREIVHVGAVPPEEMPGIYAAADLLVFPSIGDPWGLVVNEALACGLPVLCSALAGCADDLIEPEGNGWLFDPTDAGSAATALGEALTSNELDRLGLRALETAKRFPPERMADGLRRAIVHAAARRGGSPR
jgi:glycosyltransferase involved in cell wall biosynthesis